MIEVYPHIFVGPMSDCRTNSAINTVHLPKIPCHQNAVGYTGNLDKNHPNYLWKESSSDIFFNTVDCDGPGYWRIEIFRKFLDWTIPRYNQGKRILIHCNAAQSRSPAFVMFLDAWLNKKTWEQAYADMMPRYPEYNRYAVSYKLMGVSIFLRDHWKELLDYNPNEQSA